MVPFLHFRYRVFVFGGASIQAASVPFAVAMGPNLHRRHQFATANGTDTRTRERLYAAASRCDSRSAALKSVMASTPTSLAAWPKKMPAAGSSANPSIMGAVTAESP